MEYLCHKIYVFFSEFHYLWNSSTLFLATSSIHHWLKILNYLILELVLIFHIYTKANYTPNEVDILLYLGECQDLQEYLCLYTKRYPDCHHSNTQQVINIERRSRQNPFYQQRQQNRNIYNHNDQRPFWLVSLFKSVCKSSVDWTWIRDSSINRLSHAAIC